MPAPSALFENLGLAVFLYDAEKILWASEEASRLTGLDPETLTSTPFWDLAGSELRGMVRDLETKRLVGDEAAERYRFSLAGDGPETWVELSARRVEHEGRDAVLATATDVTAQREAEQRAAEAESRLKLSQRAGKTLTWDWRPHAGEVSFSPPPPELQDFLPSPKERPWRLLRWVHRDDRSNLNRELRRLRDAGGKLNLEARFVTPWGGERWLRLQGQATTAGLGRTLQVVGVATDVTETLRVRQDLDAARESTRTILASVGEGVLTTDAKGQVVAMNPVAEEITGWSEAEALGRPMAEVFQVLEESTHEPVASPVEQCIREHRSVVSPGKSLLARKDGTELPIRYAASLVRGADQRITGAVLVLRDLTELQRVERNLRYLATHDPHTGLVNRTELERRLQHALGTAREDGLTHAFFYLDIDEFKLINDSCGHLAGDELLKQVGSILKCRFRGSDTLGRLGGDEFGVLLEGCAPAKARDLAERLRQEVRAFRFIWEGQLFTPSVSIGLVLIDGHSADVAKVLADADEACYTAKERGGDRVQLHQDGDDTLVRLHGQLDLYQVVRKALDNHQLCLYQQVLLPITAPRAGKMYELLVRILDAKGRLLQPAIFMPVAERHRLMIEIDRWVLRTALNGLSEGGGISELDVFAINLSGQSLGEEQFLDYAMTELDLHGVAAERIFFEITETAAISDLGRATRFISALRSRGCRFVLDDFGTGLSSFAYLRNLPVDFIKIDGQFVKGLTKDPIQRALVESINHVGHVMQMKTVAESVEDEETLEALKQMRVDFAQGFFIARPEPFGAAAAQTETA